MEVQPELSQRSVPLRLIQISENPTFVPSDLAYTHGGWSNLGPLVSLPLGVNLLYLHPPTERLQTWAGRHITSEASGKVKRPRNQTILSPPPVRIRVKNTRISIIWATCHHTSCRRIILDFVHQRLPGHAHRHRTHRSHRLSVGVHRRPNFYQVRRRGQHLVQILLVFAKLKIRWAPIQGEVATLHARLVDEVAQHAEVICRQFSTGIQLGMQPEPSTANDPQYPSQTLTPPDNTYSTSTYV